MLRLRTVRFVRAEDGFGMIELLAAMVVMLVGILAVFSLFQAGMVQLRRASTATTAAAIADSEMEHFRAIRYDSIGLADAAVLATDATYKAHGAYKADTSPAATLSSGITSAQLTIPVSSAAGFPSAAPYIVKIGDELVQVSGGAGTTTWTVRENVNAANWPRDGRGYLQTDFVAHSAAATVTQIQRVSRCGPLGADPCTASVPTKTVPGADGHPYRVDTYITWFQISGGSASTTGRLVKLVTIVVRDSVAPYRKWAQLSSAFDEATGV
jgi:Tfp pilus assembly protein PilV